MWGELLPSKGTPNFSPDASRRHCFYVEKAKKISSVLCAGRGNYLVPNFFPKLGGLIGVELFGAGFTQFKAQDTDDYSVVLRDSSPTPLNTAREKPVSRLMIDVVTPHTKSRIV